MLNCQPAKRGLNHESLIFFFFSEQKSRNISTENIFIESFFLNLYKTIFVHLKNFKCHLNFNKNLLHKEFINRKKWIKK